MFPALDAEVGAKVFEYNCRIINKEKAVIVNRIQIDCDDIYQYLL